MERFSNKLSVAPTASISIICGGASPGIEPAAANSFTHKTLSGSFNVRNPYLRALLAEKGKDTDEVWSSITTNEGSVQHLDFLTEDEKRVPHRVRDRSTLDRRACGRPVRRICHSRSTCSYRRTSINATSSIAPSGLKKGGRALLLSFQIYSACESRGEQRNVKWPYQISAN